MNLKVKICGINSALAAQSAGEADFIGFVFYPPSPRAVNPEEAARLAGHLLPSAKKVGLFVDAEDAAIAAALAHLPLDILQFHGEESPDRVRDARKKFNLPVMKAIKIAGPEDVEAASAYFEAADSLLFDAKPPAKMKKTLPGGNALAFDWKLIAGRDWPLPWMLSGGLAVENLAVAVKTSGTRAVDVSSGVEDEPGRKSPAKIRAFIQAAARL
ncbi:MAG: phosphoribosylanthranilate isomerase [Rhodospirillaceae bacterium]|jgi:phosphoribosylanthranilate isomerase|nr:phosphoribosylanthranilate isomerase [Rhodospirillaceae bacterium]MBT5373390.1 phosphoribosylanthranilate isomerase [Rhodospirillaceae bacterium]MBT5659347.1 phosphoribosylanthranilate isomerase [Rhodospirillaceae bacterium]